MSSTQRPIEDAIIALSTEHADVYGEPFFHSTSCALEHGFAEHLAEGANEARLRRERRGRLRRVLGAPARRVPHRKPSASQSAFGNGRGSREGLRVGEIADRVPGEAGKGVATPDDSRRSGGR
jgi:hypothetical protein